MRFASSLTFVALAALEATCTPVELAERATPTLYLAGDSTMARNGANDGSTDGELRRHSHACTYRYQSSPHKKYRMGKKSKKKMKGGGGGELQIAH